MKKQQQIFKGFNTLKDGTVIKDEDWVTWCEGHSPPEDISNSIERIYFKNEIKKTSVTNPEKVLTEVRQNID